jgi:hypothetical protein
VLIWRASPGIRAISYCARTAILAVNGRNTVFLYTLFPCPWAIISQTSPGVRAMSCCARTAILAVNGGNIVFLYTLFLYPWAIISQIFPGSRKSSNYSTSCPRILSITFASSSTSNAILAEFL